MENKEPSRDSTAKQETAGEEYKQEADQLLELHRQDKILPPSELLAVLSAYMLFVGAVTGVGVLASYSHHETTANVFLIVCIPLILLALLGVVWYLLISFRKKPTAREVSKRQRLLGRIERTAVIRFFDWLGRSRIRFLVFPFFVYTIAESIRAFPLHPRSSLTIIVVYLSLSLVLLILESNQLSSRALTGFIRKDSETQLKTVEILQILSNAVGDAQRTAEHAKALAEINSKYIDDTAPADSNIHKAIITATEHIQESVQALDSKITLLTARLDAMTEPKQLDVAPAEEKGDE